MPAERKIIPPAVLTARFEASHWMTNVDLCSNVILGDSRNERKGERNTTFLALAVWKSPKGDRGWLFTKKKLKCNYYINCGLALPVFVANCGQFPASRLLKLDFQ